VRITLVAVAAALLTATAALAIDTEQAFDDPAMNQRYRALIREVRCLVCQNETIADSNAPLAADLRREIRNLMAEGATDREITAFLVARYGDFVLFRPPVQPNTWALWGAPFILLAIGAFVFIRILRSRAGRSLDDEPFEGVDEPSPDSKASGP
jgi:cytochrome c-type biogenesis protein CcmH